ncbi:MAG: DegT/DnrJ/EryC1/StrS family aminotransferase [Desulfovibrionaceae bacterium]|nr:DegT/DnrJ/EryC1/StrS family aminotransferase [Desulfovibrionaceae bacterium]
MAKDAVYVTRTRMPEFKTLCEQIQHIIDSGWITNDGECVRQLEKKLSAYLGCPHLLACNNGTTALMLALECAGLRNKKVAVTAYTYVATLSAMLWIGCTPIFIDIDPDTLSMSPYELEQAFSNHPEIAGVVPVNIYGLACDNAAISEICTRHGAKLIYDGAQAFGSSWQGRSLLDFGDYSICSFHATKIFHTVEGGCVIAHSKEALDKLALIRAFGHRGDTHFTLGINSKMSEFHAAVGLNLLPQTDTEIIRRKKLHALYDALLANAPLTRPRLAQGLNWNYAYYPILLTNNSVLQNVITALAKENIHPRRYFFPALTKLPYVHLWCRPCPVAEDVTQRVLCLPLYSELSDQTISKIVTTINEQALG